MKKLAMAGLAALTVLSLPAMAAGGEEEDGRVAVEMSPAMESHFLSMMRGFLDSLDDLTNALGEGDFREIARVAGEDMGPAHELMARLRAAKVPPEKMARIAKLVRRRMAEMDEEGVDGEQRFGVGRIVRQVLGDIPGVPVGHGPGAGRGLGGGGAARDAQSFADFGHEMRPEMRAMGMQVHILAGKIADLAEKVPEKPAAEDYRNIAAAMGELTAQCRACHAAWKIKR